MGSLVLTGDTSGSVTVAVPLVAGSNTATIAAATGTHFPFTAGTSVASTSGTSIDFTSIPSWVKRITVMFNGVSTNGTSNPLIQIGSGSVDTSGYSACAATTLYTTGFGLGFSGATNSISSQIVLTLQTGNSWVCSHIASNTASGGGTSTGAGNKTLSGVLDRLRITTVNGTDTFDAGSINILYE